MPLRFDHVTLGQRVVFDTGHAVDSVAGLVEEFGATRVLLVADASAADLADELAEQIPTAARIAEVVQHVPAERARDAARLAETANCDLVVSIGGGSATGLAKAVARETGSRIIAVPTTFAGSEATDVWGMTEHQRKVTGKDPRVLPAAVVYDAALTVGLPAGLAIASGLNAVAHAVDSAWAPGADPLNLALGVEGLRALVPGLRGIRSDPADLDAREQVLYGAYLAAVSFASAGSGLHHKICHVLGGMFALPHAETHSVVLPHVLELNASHAPGAERRLAAAFDSATATGGLGALLSDLESPTALEPFGMPEDGIQEAAAAILAAAPPGNPAPLSEDDLVELLRGAWSGQPARRTRAGTSR